MLASLTHTQRRTGDLRVMRMEYTEPRSKQIGRLSARIPRTSTLYDSQAVNLDGGSKIVVRNEPHGDWYGMIVDPPEFDENDTILIDAYQITNIVKAPDISTGQVFRSETPATIVRAALTASLEGNNAIPVIAGHFVDAPPIIPYYKLERVKLDKVLSDMEAASGQEWELEPVAGSEWQFRFHWKAPAAVAAYERTLILGTDLVYMGSGRGEGERVARVTGVDRNGRTHTATSPDLANADPYPVELTVAIDTTSEDALIIETEAILALRRYPRITHKLKLLPAPPWAQTGTGAVGGYGTLDDLRMLKTYAPAETAYANWRAVRPGAIIRILIPAKRIVGISTLVRVTKVTCGESMKLPEIDVEEIRPPDARTILALARSLQIVPAPIAGSLLALLVMKLNSGGPRGSLGPLDIQHLSAAQLEGLISPQQIEKLYGSQVSGAVASATAAASVPATGVGSGNLGALVAADPTVFQNGAIKVGVTIGGGQVSSPVADATTAANVAATGVGAGNLGAGVAASPAALQAGAAAAGVTLATSQLTGTIVNAQVGTGAIKRDTTAFETNAGATITGGSAPALPGQPQEYIEVKNASGQTRLVPTFNP